MSNPLHDIIPAQYRRLVYALIALAALVWSAIEAAGGDWRRAVSGVIVSLSQMVAASNVTALPGRDYQPRHADAALVQGEPWDPSQSRHRED